MNLKKERNCAGYPVYPNMGGMPMPLPMYPNMNMYPSMNTYPSMNSSADNSMMTDLNSLNSKINKLEQRVTAIENAINNSYTSNYNTSNYQMM